VTNYTVVTVPGIGEPLALPGGKPNGLLKVFTDALPSRFTSKQFDWRNQYGPVPVWNGHAYDENLEHGTESLVNFIQAQPTPVLLVGYSGGAGLASRAGALNPSNLAAIAMVSNPSRHRADSSAPWWGITGEHLPFGVPLFDIANPADVICCCPENQPLRDFADLSSRFSLADPAAWGRDLLNKAIRGALTNSVVKASLWDWWFAIAYARGYLYDGQHTNWYIPRLPAFAGTVAAALP
jgi:pimeloyl-ACP methyl ester carboxylesterase